MNKKAKKLSYLIMLVMVVGLTISFQSCEDEYNIPETCFDGKQNGNETGVDCGGDCQPCPSCDDGIMNGNETGVDCGGPDCDACPETCDDGILNNGETEIDCGGPNCPPCVTAAVTRFFNYQSAGFERFHTFEGEETGVNLIDGDPGNDVTTQGAALPMVTFGEADPEDATMLVGRYNRPEGNISDGFSDYKFEINSGAAYDFTGLGNIELSVYTPAGTIGGNVTPTVEIIFIARNDPNPNFWEHWTILNGVLSGTDEWETITFDGSGVQASMNGFGVQYDQIAIRIGGSGHTEAATFYIKDFVFIDREVVASATFATNEGVNINPDGDPGNDVTTQGAPLPMMEFGVVGPENGFVGKYNRPEGNISDGFSDYKFEINSGDPYTFATNAKFSLEVYTPSGTIGGNVTPTVEIIILARNDANPNFWEHWTILNAVIDTNDEWQTFTFDASGVQASMSGFGVQYDQIAIRIGGSGHTEPATFYVRNFNWYNAD
ncbi:hypothetical protein [Winogradskyella sp.]|uniref:hypothetical protein n=1 Tax=Winogradskyella sp. TaxID=1883156 RepID=UPI003BA95DD6